MASQSATLGENGWEITAPNERPVTSRTTLTGGITKIWTGTQAEYDAIATPADDTLYVIAEA